MFEPAQNLVPEVIQSQLSRSRNLTLLRIMFVALGSTSDNIWASRQNVDFRVWHTSSRFLFLLIQCAM